jgi:hypothetical protein
MMGGWRRLFDLSYSRSLGGGDSGRVMVVVRSQLSPLGSERISRCNGRLGTERATDEGESERRRKPQQDCVCEEKTEEVEAQDVEVSFD